MSLRPHRDFLNVFEMRHPLISHKMSLLRDAETTKKQFKELVYEITLLMAYEATAGLPLRTEKIQTPLEEMEAPFILGKKPLLMPILRAGLGMVDSFLAHMPGARVGHIGMYRDEETLEPKTYFFKIPPSSSERQVYVLDPMLATGGSAVAAIERIKQANLKRIKFVCLLAAPEGLKALAEAHPDIEIFAGCVDRQLNEKGYILPGLGDAGDRLYGTR